jgi:predicted DNA-binding transcriptional regulator AlpA
MGKGNNYIDKDQYPSVLDPIHIQEILGIGRKQVYELLNQDKPPFHFIRIGRLIKISKSVFLQWLEGRNQFPAPGHGCPFQSLLENGITLTLKMGAGAANGTVKISK